MSSARHMISFADVSPRRVPRTPAPGCETRARGAGPLPARGPN
jgi:hypothetical protein